MKSTLFFEYANVASVDLCRAEHQRLLRDESPFYTSTMTLYLSEEHSIRRSSHFLGCIFERGPFVKVHFVYWLVWKTTVMPISSKSVSKEPGMLIVTVLIAWEMHNIRTICPSFLSDVGKWIEA